MRDRDRGTPEIKAMHQNACDNAVGNANAIRPFRSRNCGDHGHQPDHQCHPDREVSQRVGVVHDVFGSDETGTPKQNKDRRRRARGKTVKVMIHLLL